MGLFDLGKKKQKSDLEIFKESLDPEILNAVDLQDKIQGLEATISVLEEQKNSLDAEISEKKALLIQLDEEILLQEFGLYTPVFDFVNSEEYKNRITALRAEQKELIKKEIAATGSTTWTVNGSQQKGRKMVKDMQKLLLRAFNTECDSVIAKVKFNNFTPSFNRITSARDAISKLGAMMGVSISKEYYDLKIQELHLALEYQQKKQQEKEEQAALRAQLREEARLAKEIEEARKAIEKEKKHYTNAKAQLEKALATAKTEAEREAINEKLNNVTGVLDGISEKLASIDYREANKRAGYVYVISNIGAFGENVYKIGMTRRLEPMDRVNELGDASVPFNFDVHAMIFSDDAPALENALHNAFADRKVNMVNARREFFNVSIEEIEQVVKANYDKSVEFIRESEAEQYRETLRIKKLI